jgi:hypothetical protein
VLPLHPTLHPTLHGASVFCVIQLCQSFSPQLPFIGILFEPGVELGTRQTTFAVKTTTLTRAGSEIGPEVAEEVVFSSDCQVIYFACGSFFFLLSLLEACSEWCYHITMSQEC